MYFRVTEKFCHKLEIKSMVRLYNNPTKHPPLRLAFIFAHGDDETNGPGGTIARLAAAGHNITFIVTTDGKGDLCEVRRNEVRASAKVLGVTNEPIFLGWIDGKTEDTVDTRKIVSDLLDELNPHSVFAIWPVDVHPDHRVVGALALNWCMQRGRNVELFFWELCSSGRGFPSFRPQSLAFYPTYYVSLDVEDGKYLDLKHQATRCHVSQEPEGEMGMIAGNTTVLLNRGKEYLWDSLWGGYVGEDLHTVTHAEAFVRATRWYNIDTDDGHPLLDVLHRSSRSEKPRGIGCDYTRESIFPPTT